MKFTLVNEQKSKLKLMQMQYWHKWWCSIGFVLLNIFICFTTYAYDPIPSYYQDPGLSPNRHYVEQHVTEHIDPFTGKLQIHSVDLFIPGNGNLDIKVQRSYTSINEFLIDPNDRYSTEASPIGVGWTMHFGRVMRRQPISLCSENIRASNAPIIELPDGSRDILYLMTAELERSVGLPNTQVNWITKNRWRAQCAANGIGMIVFSPDGMRYEMTTSGKSIGDTVFPTHVWYTTSIVDRNGNRLELEYIDVGSTTAVHKVVGRNADGTPDGREVTFNYSEDSLETVTDGVRTWTYHHVFSSTVTGSGSFPFLASVERPDGQFWRYEYTLDKIQDVPGAYSMRKMIYPTGGSFSYSYGFIFFDNTSFKKSTVVSRKVSDVELDGWGFNNGSVWEFIYNPAQRPCELVSNVCNFVDGSYDQTIIKAPDTIYEYRHVGLNSVHGGLFWATGQLLSKRVDGSASTGWYEIQQPLFDAQIISNSYIMRPGISTGDAYVYAAINVGNMILRNGTLYQTEITDHDMLGNAGAITETGPDGYGGKISRRTNLQYFINPEKWMIRLPTLERMISYGNLGYGVGENSSVVGDIVRRYDSNNGNLLEENRYGVITHWTYTEHGDIATRIDARQKEIRYSNYFRGIPQTEIHPESVVVRRLIDDFGNVIEQTDGENRTIKYQYDNLNRIISIDYPLETSNDVNVSWSGNNRIVTRGPYVETTTFDGYGRIIDIKHLDDNNGQSITQTFAYDVYGRRRFESYPNDSRGTKILYDVLGRAVRIEHAITRSGIEPLAVVTNSYHGSHVRTTSERGFLTTYVYRSFGNPDTAQLMQIMTPPGVQEASISITRNLLGQPLTVTQDNKTRKFEYDDKFFLWKQTDPEIGVTEFGRDEIGNMIWREVGAEARTDFTYDGRNRLEAIRYQAATSVPAASNVVYSYFKDDKIKSIENVSALREFEYDTNKNLVLEKLKLPESSPFEMQYIYDGNDVLSAMIYGTGSRINYSPDAFGRPTEALPYLTKVEYFANGAIKHMAYANGVTTDFKQNARLWIESIKSISSINSVVDLEYGYDALGNVSRITDRVDTNNNRSFDYDPIERLTGILAPSIIGGGVSFDGRGNLTSKFVGKTRATYTYDSETDRLIQVEGTVLLPNSTGGSFVPFSYALAYDVLGNIIQNRGINFQFNTAQQMICSRCTTAEEVRYSYDGKGSRVARIEGQSKTSFVYNSAGKLLWEVAPDNHIREYYYLGNKQIAVRRTRP